jgi:hypothetical protein
MAPKMKHTKGERLNIHFNRKIKLEFHGARLTSDGGLPSYREFDDALGLFESVKAKAGFQSKRILAIQYHNIDMGNIYFCSDAYISCSRMDTKC